MEDMTKRYAIMCAVTEHVEDSLRYLVRQSRRTVKELERDADGTHLQTYVAKYGLENCCIVSTPCVREWRR